MCTDPSITFYPYSIPPKCQINGFASVINGQFPKKPVKPFELINWSVDTTPSISAHPQNGIQF